MPPNFNTGCFHEYFECFYGYFVNLMHKLFDFARCLYFATVKLTPATI
jgi:hypothetical protein